MLYDEALGSQHCNLTLAFILVLPLKLIRCLYARIYETKDLCAFIIM